MDRGFSQLAFEIINQAVEDYKRSKYIDESDTMDMLKYKRSVNREVRRFFKSEWCDFLLQNMSITGEDILRYLNKE